MEYYEYNEKQFVTKVKRNAAREKIQQEMK